MSEVLQVVTIDGESKTCKTTVADALEQVAVTLPGYEDEGAVETQVAGNFFRAVAHVALDLTNCKVHQFLDNQRRLTQLTAEVLKNFGPTVYNPRTIGNLNTTELDKLSTFFGGLDITQEAAEKWYDQIIDGAIDKGTKLLVIDGRNPAARIMHRIFSGEVDLKLNLLQECRPEVAATRCLPENAGKELIEKKKQQIIERRALDRAKHRNPFVEPSMSLRYMPHRDLPAVVIERAYSHPVPVEDEITGEVIWLPKTIRNDVSGQDREPMINNAQGLLKPSIAA